MKKSALYSLILASVCSLFISCASAPEQTSLFPEYDLGEIQQQAISADSAASAAINDVAIINTALLTTRQELNALEETQADVSPARLEELELQLALLTEAFKDLYATVAAIKVLPQIRYAPVEPTRPEGFVVSTATAMFNGDEHDIFSRAMESYRKQFFLESRQLFTAMIEKFPDGRLTDRGYYWIGESFFAEEDYSQAVIYFEKVLKFESSSKADDGLYKMALSYYRSGENDIARELFQQVTMRYPASEYVPRSSEYVQRLGM